MTSSGTEKSDVDLAAVVTRVVDRHAALAEASGVTVKVQLPKTPIRVATDPSLIERAISNVLANAIEHSAPTAGTVTVALEPIDGPARFMLRITDTGRGVTEDEFRGLTAVRRFRLETKATIAGLVRPASASRSPARSPIGLASSSICDGRAPAASKWN